MALLQVSSEVHQHNVSAVVALSDQCLASAGEDGAVRTWSTSPSSIPRGTTLARFDVSASTWSHPLRLVMNAMTHVEVVAWMTANPDIPDDVVATVAAKRVDGQQALQAAALAHASSSTPQGSTEAEHAACAACAALVAAKTKALTSHEGTTDMKLGEEDAEAKHEEPSLKAASGRAWCLIVLPDTGSEDVRLGVGTDNGFVVVPLHSK